VVVISVRACVLRTPDAAVADAFFPESLRGVIISPVARNHTIFVNALTRRAILVFTLIAAVCETVIAAQFKVRLIEGQVPPGMTDGVQFLDQLTLTNSGQIFLGVDTIAGTNDEAFYKATLKPFALSLVSREGDAVPSGAGRPFGAMDAVNDMNEAGDTVFVSATPPTPTVDVLAKNGVRFLHAGVDLLNGEVLNSMHQPQIDGTGTPWFLADIGTNTATDIALFHGTTMLFREGGTIDGVPVSSLSISESTSGANFRVNEAGDYIIVVDDGDAQGQDVHVILNGENVIESTDVIPGHGSVYWFNQIDITSTGNHWWCQLTLDATGGDELILLDGTTVLVKEGDDLGGGITVGTIQTADVNVHGDWIARVDLGGTATGQDGLLLNGQLIARTGDPVDADYNWGTSFGFINDIRLNDCGEIAIIGDVVPIEVTTPLLEALITGSIYDPGDIDGDGDIGTDDVDAFVGVLLGTVTDTCIARRADMNDDGLADGRDVQTFVAATALP